MSTEPINFSDTIELARQAHFPFQLSNGVTARIVDKTTFDDFFSKHASAVFPSFSSPMRVMIPEVRQQQVGATSNHYMQNGHRDHVLFFVDDKAIGWTKGEQADHTTYYMRNTAIIPEYQNQGIYTEFMPRFFAYLRDIGYERITSQHSPYNSRVLTVKLKAGFFIGGLDLDDRFGSLVKLVKYLHDDRVEHFKKRFES